jgi:hypothetical protein
MYFARMPSFSLLRALIIRALNRNDEKRRLLMDARLVAALIMAAVTARTSGSHERGGAEGP